MKDALFVADDETDVEEMVQSMQATCLKLLN